MANCHQTWVCFLEQQRCRDLHETRRGGEQYQYQKRATDLGCITPGSARYLWMSLSKRGYRKGPRKNNSVAHPLIKDLGVYSRCGRGREPGYPGPPAQIRTCALAHTAPTLGG